MILPGGATPPHTRRSIHRAVMWAKVGFLTSDVLIGLELRWFKREPRLGFAGFAVIGST